MHDNTNKSTCSTSRIKGDEPSNKFKIDCENNRKLLTECITILYSIIGDGLTLSPVMIYNEDSMLNSQNITVEGIGNTVQLICVGSNTNQTDSIMVRYQTTTVYHNLVCFFRLNLLNYLKDAFCKNGEF